MSFPGMIIGVLATIVITMTLVMVIGCGDEAPVPAKESAPAASEGTSAEKAVAIADTVTVCAPLNGTVKSNTAVNNPTFAEGILGMGAAIVPTEGKLYAPFDCTIFGVADTKHAINLVGLGDIEMLIHIGLDTVELAGRCFSPKVKGGDTVKAGDLLIELDLEEIKKKYDTITPSW